MCPRKSAEGKVANWAYKMYKAKGRSISSGPYECPNCCKKNLVISVDKNQASAEALCNCGFNCKLKYVPINEPVDYLSQAIDKYYKKE